MELKILIDWDSTLNNFDVHFLQKINEKFGTNYTIAHMTHWDWVRRDIAKEHVDYWWNVLFRDKDTNMEMRSLPGSVLGTNMLIDAGHEVHVVSSRLKYMRPWIVEWLSKEGYDPRVIVATDSRKGDYAKKHGIQAAVEDAPHNALDLSSAKVETYLVDRPWNRYHNNEPLSRRKNIIRVPSVWVAAENILDRNEIR